jgi:hydroxyacylglutathione hydrolase
MEIKQWEDKHLSHFSYAILSESDKQIILIDPARDPSQYLEYAASKKAVITGVVETHPHADFVSSHLEFHQRHAATIYCSKLVDASYPHKTFDDGDEIKMGNIVLAAINTPGHSPDSISVLLKHKGESRAVFTGDTLFIGDCGRPDLRENGDDVESGREKLASQMYDSLRTKLGILPGNVVVYPAHGAGTLCGKALSKASESTIAQELAENWSLQDMSKDEFIKELLEDQPFIPAYFSYNVLLNKKGAPPFQESIDQVVTANRTSDKQLENINSQDWIIDSRDQASYKAGHLPNSINLQNGEKFETWLGSILKPKESFYLGSDSEEVRDQLIKRSASIGYEGNIDKAIAITGGPIESKTLDLADFRKHTDQYTIVDVRNESETKAHKIFKNSLPIPLGEIRERTAEIPLDKPIVVHCAGGYRSAAASSILESQLTGKAVVYDLGDSIKDFS